MSENLGPSTQKGSPKYAMIKPVEGEILPRGRVDQGALNAVNYAIGLDVTPNATQHVEVKTSQVDSAWGFLIKTIPLAALFGFVAVLIVWFFAETPFLSLPTLLAFWVTLAITWAWMHKEHMRNTAEGVSRYETERKWNWHDKEQSFRHEYYRKLLRDR